MITKLLRKRKSLKMKRSSKKQIGLRKQRESPRLKRRKTPRLRN